MLYQRLQCTALPFRKCYPNLQCIMQTTKFYLISFWRKIIVYKWLITEKVLIMHSFWVLINQNSWKWDFKNYSSKLFVWTSNLAVILVNKKIYFIHCVHNVHKKVCVIWTWHFEKCTCTWFTDFCIHVASMFI